MGKREQHKIGCYHTKYDYKVGTGFRQIRGMEKKFIKWTTTSHFIWPSWNLYIICIHDRSSRN